jgi:hypothetical protein
MTPFTIHLSCSSFYLIAGAILIGGAFSKKGRVAPRWIRIALVFAGSLTLLDGVAVYTILFLGKLLPEQIYMDLLLCNKLLSGAVLGILMLMFISGDFMPSFSKKKKNAIHRETQT